MKKAIYLLAAGICCVLETLAQPVYKDKTFQSNHSLTYEEAINSYKALDLKYPQGALFTGGPTDIGKPLHLFVISSDGDFDPVSIRKKGKAVFFINNAIHPGEPDGIDASLMFAKELLEGGKRDSLLNKVVVCIVPVFNIDGTLNRGCCSRANQEGPEEYGFRGNARNLDLNRDFIKADSKNVRSFISLFRKWNPDIFADTHVSDGADYQYTMTIIPTQHNKLFSNSGNYMKNRMCCAIYNQAELNNFSVCPYVNTRGETPESGIEGYLETPRYASGYAALFNTLGFVYETHMLKPFNERVEATYKLLFIMLGYTNTHAAEILKVKKQSDDECAKKSAFPLEWQLDTTAFEMINFKGYEAIHKTSEVTGLQRLYYDHNLPYQKSVKYFDTYKVTRSVDRPEYYVIPQAWTEVIDRMKWNEIKIIPLKKDTEILVQCYYISNYESVKNPYEGHFLHKNVTYTREKQTLKFYKGDILIPVNQSSNRFIVETLEPDAPDSYFAWGFFDSVLQQKEWFSDYVFEEKALEILNTDPTLKSDFENKKQSDKDFAADHFAQLYYIYQHSHYYEKSHNRYPVYRINQ